MESRRILATVTAALFLIDFDNVRPDAQLPFRQRNAEQAADYVRRQALQHAQGETGVTEVRLRYYGGWHLRRGDVSYDARALLRWISRISRRDQVTGLRVSTELASTLLAHPTHSFLGTLRIPNHETPSQPECTSVCALHCSPRPHQKMVDMMLGLDLMTVVSVEPAHAVLFSSDEDLFPAVIAAIRSPARAASVTWIRPGRATGNSPNDVHVAQSPIRIRA